MATYKVLQDIEAEDKLVGPFSLRQFIYLGIVFVLGFISFQLLRVTWFLVIPLLPPMAFFGLLAAPIGTEQSSEIWLLAKIRFFLKPRRRIWNQDGVQELVRITAPKKIERHLTDNLSQTEVKSRLKALASTLDSRGWAVKNVNLNLYDQSSLGTTNDQRLLDGTSLPQEVPVNSDVVASDDILDAAASPTAHKLDTMMQQAEQVHREEVLSKVQGKAAGNQPADYWFMSQGQGVNHAGPTITPGDDTTHSTTQPTADEEALVAKIQQQKTKPASFAHLKTVQPLSGRKTKATKPTANPSSQTPNPDILRLANNDDLNVATIAREAKRSTGLSDEEVVISLR